MNRKSKKNIEAEKYVDDYFKENGVVPSYSQIAEHFKIGKGAAHARCRKFKSKMDKLRFAKTTEQNFVKFKIEYLVPTDKIDEFTKALDKLNSTLK